MVMFDIPAAVEVRKRFPSRLFQAGFFCLLNNRGNAGLPDSVLRTVITSINAVAAFLLLLGHETRIHYHHELGTISQHACRSISG